MLSSVIFALVATSGVAAPQHANFTSGKPHAIPPLQDPCVLQPGSITDSNDCGIEAGTGLTCSYNNLVAGDNHYLRRFQLAKDHQITSTYNVKSVQFGIEQITLSPSTPQMPITVNLYSIPTGADMTIENFRSVGTTRVAADDSASGTLFSATVSGSVDGSSSDLVVEYVVPDYKLNTAQAGSFFPGANKAGQTEPSYIYAGNCSITEPTDFTDIGYTVNLAVVVNGASGDSEYTLGGN
jgi:hypothetical protein